MKILIADDKPSNRQFLSFLLEDEGYQCVHVDNGYEAVQRYQEDLDISLILMDINMPEMDGIEATKEICRLKTKNRYTSIIFVTVLDNTDALALCLEAGGDDFIPKPVNESVLLAKIKAHFRMRDTYNELLLAHEELKFHQQVIDREHAIVEHVFANGIDRTQTKCDNIRVSMKSMSSFNGDIVLSAPSPSGGVYLLVGDFTGHGLTAAIGSLPVMSVFFKGTQNQSSVSELAREFNSYLHDVLPTGMFFCACILHLNRQGDRLSVWSGGMNDILFLPEDGGHMETIAGEHMPLGILPEDQFDETVLIRKLDKPGKLYIYTDGVVEAKDMCGEYFGEERLVNCLQLYKEERTQSVMDAIKSFQADNDQEDDISIAEVNCVPCVHRSKETGTIVDVFHNAYASGCFPWQVSFRLQGQDLARTDAVKQIVSLLVTIEGVAVQHDKLFTIISELYSNALEHGVLKLDSATKQTAEGFDQYYVDRREGLEQISDDAFIDVSLEFVRGNPNQIKIVMTDSGEGFDLNAVEIASDENDESYGRGLALLQTLCASLDYSNSGRTVTAYLNVTTESNLRI